MTAPATIVEAIAANLMADVTVGNGAPVALGHAYTGRRKSYDWQSGPFAVVILGDHGIDETRYTEGGGGKRRIKYHSAIDLAWVNPDVDDASVDTVKPEEDFLTLIEAVKASLRKHTSLGGLVLKCAEDDITVEPVLFVPQNIPHRETSMRFDVLDQITAAATG